MAKFTAYSTKYWDTAGIQELQGCEFYVHEEENDKYIRRGVSFTSADYVFQRVGKDIFLTRDEAVKSATKKAPVAKLKALDKKRDSINTFLVSLK